MSLAGLATLLVWALVAVLALAVIVLFALAVGPYLKVLAGLSVGALLSAFAASRSRR